MTSSAEILERFWSEPGGHVVVSPNLVIEEVGPAYLRMTHTTREQLIGKSFLSTVWDPDPTRRQAVTNALFKSFHQALSTGQPQKLGPLRSDIPRSRNGGFEERWWEVVLIPVRAQGDKITHLVLRLGDHTLENVLKRQITAQRRSNYVLYLIVVLLIVTGFWRFSAVTSNNHTLALRANRDEIRLDQIILSGRQERFAALSSTCNEVNRLTVRIQTIILQSVKQTKLFNRQLVALGFPPYRQRLALAQRQASTFHQTNCKVIQP